MKSEEEPYGFDKKPHWQKTLFDPFLTREKERVLQESLRNFKKDLLSLFANNWWPLFILEPIPLLSKPRLTSEGVKLVLLKLRLKNCKTPFKESCKDVKIFQILRENISQLSKMQQTYFTIILFGAKI